MILYHTTPLANLESIVARGILPECSQSPLKCVWLHNSRMRKWALQHVAKRHGAKPCDLIVFRVKVNPKQIGHVRRAGVYLCYYAVTELLSVECPLGRADFVVEL